MDRFFNKAVIFTDAHFGRNSDSPIANQDNLDFIDWMIDRARSWGAETCLFLSDMYHNRASVGVGTLNAALDGLERLSGAGFERIVLLKGNHDLHRRANRDISSLNFAHHLPNIELIRDPLTLGDVTFLPWLVEQERAMLPSLTSRYVFGHLETIGAMMNARVQCSGGAHAVEANTFVGQDLVFTGHFHQRQVLKNICYIGSIMPFDFSDVDDAARGATLLSWGHDPVFEAWPEQPLYHAGNLSCILNNLGVLRPKMTLRAAVDIELGYEEAQQIRQMLVESYGLRKFELTHLAPVVPSDEPATGELQTVDQIVIDGLQGIDSAELSCARLIQIFTDLPR
jgi:hypothetical protein